MEAFSRQILFFAIFSFGCAPLFSQRDENGKDRTESPYFEIAGKRGEKETLPLLSTNANVNIAGIIADVKVTQVYVNRGNTPIEASYIFPLSTRAAVYGMQFTLGKRIVKAQIQEKEKALQIYNEAKSGGKTTALVQQHRPNVFQMNLANIMPGDTIRVDLFYTELIQSEDGIYEFVYPTVVGPRYTDDPLSSDVYASNEKWTGTPYTEEKKYPTYLFNIQTRLNAGVPVSDVTCSSHEVEIKYVEATSAQINLKSPYKLSGNKDFILKYRLTGSKIQNGILCYEGEKENYFVMMLQPPKTVTAKDLPGREYVFIMDVSGSQSGFPIEISKVLMKNLLTDLRPQDKFNVLVFEGSAGFMSDKSLEATPENIQKAVAYVQRQNAGGSTNMLGALKKAMTFPRTENYSRTFAISTDGYVSIEKDAFEYIKQNLGDANFFAFGIGTSVNRYIVEGIAHAGMGEPFIVPSQAEAASVAEKFKNYIADPVLTNIKINYNGFSAYDVVPQHVPDVFAQRPIIVFGKYKGSPSGNINVSGITAAGNFTTTMNIASAKAAKENSALKYLWARHKIREYDFDGRIGNEVKKEITTLGLKYNLLTDYTSFVAVDNVIRNTTGKIDSVVQPLPLPEGVSNSALGANQLVGNANTSNNKNISYNGTNNPVNRQGNYSYSNTGSNSGAGVPAVTTATYYTTTKPGAEKKQKETYAPKKEAGKPTDNTVAYEYQNKTDENAEEIKAPLAAIEGKIKIKRDKNSDTMTTENKIYCVADIMPQYAGGQEAMVKFLNATIKYPVSAKKRGIEGKVYVQFIVGKDGEIRNIKVIKGVDEALDEETIRVIKLMPKWLPGKMGQKNVDVVYTLPVKFKL